MPSFFKTEKENTSKTRLIDNLKIYSEKTGRNVVIYASNFLNNDSEEYYINSFDKNGFMKVMNNLNKSKGLDLILHTPGGAISETESNIDYLHVQFNQNIRAIIPQMAMSGGTMIACSCNEIYMGNQSSLGPVDPQILDMSAKSVIKEHELAKKEIMEQPRAVKATIEPRIQDNKIVLDDINITAEDFKNINKIVITACGSAYYAGCAGKYALEKLCRIPVSVELASELRYGEPLIDNHTLLIVLSQSGETADTIAAMKECKSKGAKVLAIVNVVGSTIANLADFTIYTWAGPEIAVATTKGYTTQVAVVYLLAIYIAKLLERIEEDTYEKCVAQVKNLPKLIQQAIDMNSSIEKMAKKNYKNSSMFFIGRNTDYAIALEASLKMKEISYIHAESYAAGELKHGTIALIEEKQPVVALCCNDRLFEKIISNIVEVKARGAEVLAVACVGNEKIVSVADDTCFVPAVDPVVSAAVEIVPLQLLAYYVAKEKGCDIDKPKNLAKSVTVE